MMAANQGSEPIFGTKNSDVVTTTTPMAPPVQIHHGEPEGEVRNEGGKTPEIRQRINKNIVPIPNEISAAWNG